MIGNLEHCLDTITRQSGVSRQEALDILEKVADRAEEMRRTGTPDAAVAAAGKLSEEFRAKAEQDRLDAIRNATARAEITARINQEAGDRVAPGVSANLIPSKSLIPGFGILEKRGLGIADGLRWILHWVPGAERKDNVESLWVGLSRQLISPIGNRLRQLGLEKAATSDGLRNEVAEAMWRANGGAPDARVTVSTPAQQIAEAFMAPLRLIKERQNAVGARIGDAIDYVTHTNWDSRQLRLAAGAGADREAAYQAWKTRDVPRMADKTFEGLTPRDGETIDEAKERFVRSIYDATQSGVHMRGTAMAGFETLGDYVPPVYEGTRNIARSASQQRVVTWKSAQDWADHMHEFGGGQSLYHDVVKTLDTGARRTALMQYLGTNPAANLETIIQRLVEKNRTSDQLGRMENQLEGVRNVLGRLDGSLNVPIHADAGELTNQLMSLEAVSHLGGVSITHLSAAPGTFSSEMVHHGVGRLETMANIVKALTTGRGTAEAQEALADSGAFAHGYTLGIQRAGTMGEAWRRDGVPGFASWASAHFMRLTGLPQILDALQAKSVKSVLMSRLGRQADKDFAGIEEHQRNVLGSYGIGSEEWNLIRGASDPTMVEGQRWMTPTDATKSDPAQVEALLRSRGQIAENASAETTEKAVQKFQWELGDKLLMYLNDAGDRGAVRPGVRERAMVLGRLRPGEPGYFVARAVSQFKMWPLPRSIKSLGAISRCR